MPTARPLLAAAAIAALLAGCERGKTPPAAIDTVDNRLAEGVATNEGERRLRQSIRVDPARAQAPAGGAPATAGETCLERHATTLTPAPEWRHRLPAGFVPPAGATVIEAAGHDGRDCTIRIVSLIAPGRTREAVAAAWTQAAGAAGYDAGRTTRGGDLVVAGTKGDAAYMVMIGMPAGGAVPVDWIWSRGG